MNDDDARYAATLDRIPVGSAVTTHRDFEARLWKADVDCDGTMVIVEGEFPFVVLVCERCHFEASVPVRFAHLIPDPLPPVSPEDRF
jgi:hypothetical protein